MIRGLLSLILGGFTRRLAGLGPRHHVLQVVFDLAPVPILVIRKDGQIVMANRVWHEAHPATAQIYNVFRDPDLKATGVMPTLETALMTGQTQVCTLDEMLVSIDCLPPRWNQARQFIIRFDRITRERDHHLELARQVDLTQSILNNSQAVVFAKDLQGRYLLVNSEWQVALGLPASGVLGRTDHEIFPPDIAARFVEVDAQVLREQRGMKLEETAPHADGVHAYLTVKFPIVDATGAVIALGGISTDISAMKKIENERAELVLREKAANEASRLKSIFLANVSHELRTPLNGVMGMAELLRRTSLTEQQKVFTDAIASSADALLVLVSDVLDLTCAEAGQIQTEHMPLDLNHILSEVEDTLVSSARAKSLNFKVARVPDTNNTYLGDSARVRQVLLNLVRNAIKFTDRGSVSVSVSTVEKFIRFEVSDSGMGVPLKLLPDLFTSFAQADTSSTRKFGGSGLGLAIAKHLVTLMGGEIGVRDPSTAPGAQFWFTIPLARTNDVS